MRRPTTPVIAAIAALTAMASVGHEAEDAATPFAEAREQIADARARLAAAAQELAAAAKTLPGAWPARAFLGILVANQDEDGLHVAGTTPDSGAAAAGLKAKDIVVAINDESLLGSDRPLKVLHGVLESIDPGADVQLAVLRDGERHTFEVTTTPLSAERRLHDRLRWFRDGDDVDVDIDLPVFDAEAIILPGHSRDHRRDGLRLADIGEDLGEYFGVDAGVLVLDTPAKSELRPGDIIKRIDGAAVSSANDAYRLLRRLEQDAPAEVRRKNRKVTVEVAARQGGRRNGP